VDQQLTITLSTHVLDVERGCPAAGVPIGLFQGERQIATATTNADGRVADLGGGSIEPGTYRIVFDVASYLAEQDRISPFLQRVSIEFAIQDSSPHYHVPLLLSPYACTSYRGS
jgi:5-hydroxyisourate hydrolase